MRTLLYPVLQGPGPDPEERFRVPRHVSHRTGWEAQWKPFMSAGFGSQCAN